MIENKVCTACGTHYPENLAPGICVICSDERQYIPEEGQTWTSHQTLTEKHKNKIVKLTDSLYEIVMQPKFAIGQRALLVISNSGNILWDCIPMLDKETIAFINSQGGIKAIAISHPHYYSNMGFWASTFNCPIYIHTKDKEYIVDKEANVKLWDGDELALWDGIKLVNLGGHFEGSSVLIVPAMSKEGVMLCGDTMYLAPSKKHFAIMYSYPNQIPLPLNEIKRIKGRLERLKFDAVYGFYSYQNLTENTRQILDRSIYRYT